MAKILALPHRSTAAVKTGPWRAIVRENVVELPNEIKGWDYATPLRITTTVDVDVERVRDDCGLSPNAIVEIVAVYYSPATIQRVVGARRTVDNAEPIELAFEIEAGELAQTVELYRRLILKESGDLQDDFAAQIVGSILWDEPQKNRVRLALEGDESQFPVTVANFAESRIGDPDSGWLLHLETSDMNALALRCLRLYVNSGNPKLEKVLSGDTRPASRVTSSVMRWDVHRAMVHAALDSEEFVEQWGSFADGSLGAALEQLLRRIWPHEDGSSLRTERIRNRAKFESTMQGLYSFLGDK